jgi:hypothetical protein
MREVSEMIRLIKTLLVMLVGSVTLLTAFTIAGIFLTGCGPVGNKPNVEIIQDMMEQPALKAQDFHPQDREKSSMLLPPEGSWPQGVKPYLFSQAQAVEAGNTLRNPYAGSSSAEIIQLGRIKYNNFCMVCHGDIGNGKGPVAEKWAPIVIPSLLTDKIRNYPDGRIFHIVTMGQGLMGSYINQLPSEEDRWALVNYVRELQKQNRGQ